MFKEIKKQSNFFDQTDVDSPNSFLNDLPTSK